MNLLEETKQHYFFVMIIEFILLSCFYWLFFPLNFSICLVYVLFSIFYFTAYKFWVNILIKKENFLISHCEHFTMINTIVLLFVLLINSVISNSFYKDMFFIYGILLAIFIAYYIFRIKKQKKSQIPIIKLSSATKLLTILSCLLLFFDFFVHIMGKLNVQLALYIPFLFLVLTFLIFIYKKTFIFKSFFALILFCNIYILATIFIVLNYISNNFFSFTVFFHFIIFISVSHLITSNSILEKEDFLYSKEFLSLISINIFLIFLYLTNILSFQIPTILISYNFFVSILLITYLAIYNYKNYIN